MDPLKLLSRSIKRSKTGTVQRSTPSSGQNAAPQLFPVKAEAVAPGSKKRKRGGDMIDDASAELDFFGSGRSNAKGESPAASAKQSAVAKQTDEGEKDNSAPTSYRLPEGERKNVLRQHKLKVTWLNPPAVEDKARSKGKEKGDKKQAKAEKLSIYPQPLQTFSELREIYGVSARIASNVEDQGYSMPTEVQLGAIPLLLESPSALLSTTGVPSATEHSHVDLLTVAPTGSGKTLAFAIPLMHRLHQIKRERNDTPRSISSIILAPTKELASQIVNECKKLARNTGLRVTQVRKGMKLAMSTTSTHDSEDEDDQPPDIGKPSGTAVKADILVSTPGALAGIVQGLPHDQSEALSNVQHLILDEADVLLDPLFREQTLAIWNGLPHPDLRVSLWSATMGSNIEELAQSIMQERRARIAQGDDDAAAAVPLLRLVVGLKDSAVPNVEHKLVYSASEQGKLMGLRNLLHPATSSTESGPPLLPPFLVFTQTIERAVALHSELLYDIPAEAGGISRIAVLHSDLSDAARDTVMTKFRRGEVWVLITTDLLSRGVDFRGVNGVVNYDIPTSSAAYIHRVGRTGRAGREGGVAVTLFSQEDIPYMKPIANVVSMAQKQKGNPDTGVQKWLLDALPDLNKKAKQDLKKHGVETRTARGMNKDPRAARKAKISTKAGFVRRQENKRRGAILGSRRRRDAASAEPNDQGADFDGFD
ncbi:ATP-dependent RNA helicase rok1 [Cercospora beticola]|uniref:ATP-dependent RNA helicase n=1 Tax=Cercospora beticola TaxID=122368 RepID=A0A2G5IDY0_CERBT|nr:ATP-dependent RNA helicase rok1 [Cercospora beticola]PIB02950.1 ATP-dependent RNA helicase rok1 [Cercospora beticola]WPB03947.1 hypothetical protein RHO25_008591 [Cercospora beticola]